MLESLNLLVQKRLLSGEDQNNINTDVTRLFSRFAPECKIESLHGSIMKDEYNRDWFKQFRIVLNALGYTI